MLVTFFDGDAAPGEDRRRIVGAREALLELGGTLARVRTPRGTAYVASVPRAGRAAAAVGAAPRSAGARGAAGRWSRSASRSSEANDEGDGAERRPRFLHGVDRGREVIDMAKAIFIGAAQAARLRDLVEQHLEGREAATAERLSDELDRAVILADGRVPSDVVAIGSRVRFVEERSGATRDVVLVYPSDADASAGRISVLAPVGAALIGLRAGDRIDWPLPGGRTARIRIAAVEQDTPVPQEAVA